MTTSSKVKILLLIAPFVFALDQITKQCIVHWIPLGTFVPVIPGIFDIVHTRNPGAAFGFLAHVDPSFRLPFFFTMSFLALTLITIYFFRLQEERRGIYSALALILGGAAGNIWDRVFLGEVVDFLSFHWHDRILRPHFLGYGAVIPLEWPAFNVADSAISIAVVWLMILMMSSGSKKSE